MIDGDLNRNKGLKDPGRRRLEEPWTHLSQKSDVAAISGNFIIQPARNPSLMNKSNSIQDELNSNLILVLPSKLESIFVARSKRPMIHCMIYLFDPDEEIF